LDFVEKLNEERRWKAATAETIKGERSKVKMFAAEDEQECEAIERYLQKVMKLDRMISQSQAGRRALLKELKQYSSKDTPPLAPKSRELRSWLAKSKSQRTGEMLSDLRLPAPRLENRFPAAMRFVTACPCPLMTPTPRL
jgi:hypothetical protein